jgi:purine catabolism regulator
MNAIKTAADLFIHRSTMNYRLERIKELTGIDFKDPDKVLYLSISMHLLFKE